MVANSKDVEIRLIEVVNPYHLYSVWYDNGGNTYVETSLMASEPVQSVDNILEEHIFAPIIKDQIAPQCLRVVHIIYRGICARPPHQY